MQTITKQAPNIKIVQHAVNYLDSIKLFEESALDVAIGDFSKAPLTLKTTGLFSDKGVIVADKHHPLMKQKSFTLKNMLRYSQVFVALEGQPEENFIVQMLEEKGHQVDIALMTPHTLIALQTLSGTTLMTNTVERLAKPFLFRSVYMYYVNRVANQLSLAPNTIKNYRERIREKHCKSITQAVYKAFVTDEAISG